MQTVKSELLSSVRIPLIGDLHVGGPKIEHLSREVEGVLLPWLEENTYDAVVQLGDWWHKRLGLDSDDAKYGVWLATRIAAMCQERNVPFRIVKGTLPHDYGQLEVLMQLEAEYPCFRIIRTAEHEQLLPGFDVLWMPEEYPKDYWDFYGRLLFEEDPETGDRHPLVYDAVMGHGEIDVAISWGCGEGEHRYGGTPMHAAEDLLACSSGAVAFGHMHKEFEYKGRLFYPGSFSRWVQGEEAEKAFSVLTQTAKRGGGWKVKRERVVNTLARTYIQRDALQLFEPSEPADAIVRKIREAADGVASLRVNFEGFPIGVEDTALVRGALINDRGVSLRFAAPTRVVEEAAAAEGEEPAVDEYAYLHDSALTEEEKLARYTGLELDLVRELTAPLK